MLIFPLQLEVVRDGRVIERNQTLDAVVIDNKKIKALKQVTFIMLTDMFIFAKPIVEKNCTFGIHWWCLRGFRWLLQLSFWCLRILNQNFAYFSLGFRWNFASLSASLFTNELFKIFEVLHPFYLKSNPANHSAQARGAKGSWSGSGDSQRVHTHAIEIRSWWCLLRRAHSWGHWADADHHQGQIRVSVLVITIHHDVIMVLLLNLFWFIFATLK